MQLSRAGEKKANRSNQDSMFSSVLRMLNWTRNYVIKYHEKGIKYSVIQHPDSAENLNKSEKK